jgi:hypothetical protein
MKKINSVILGASGEHYVMAELLRRGFIAAKAPEGVPNFDIVITDIDGTQLSAIQVKTRKAVKGGDQGWHMKAKHDHMISQKMFYVFVDTGLDENSLVQFFVMPSKIVAEACRVSHEIWEQTPNIKGEPHGHSEMRRLIPEYKRNDRMRLTREQEKFLSTHDKGWMEPYRNAWNLLEVSD